MLKQGLKNYFKSFKHFFTPLGTMFSGLLSGLSVFISGMVANVNALMGVFVGLAIFEIALCVTAMNADSYVQNLAQRKETE